MNKQELENEEVRQEEKNKEEKRSGKKEDHVWTYPKYHQYSSGCGESSEGSYWYYAFQYRAEVEPETNRKVTNTDSVYTMEQYLKTLKRNQTVYKYACDEAEVDNDYGTLWLCLDWKSTKDAESKRGRRKQKSASMTPQGLAFTEDYILVSAYCKTKAHDSGDLCDRQRKQTVCERGLC